LFLKVSGALGAGLTMSCGRPLAGSRTPVSTETTRRGGVYRVSRTEVLMGTFVSVTALHASRDEAEEAIALAFEEMARLTGVLNRHDRGSAVGLLNATGSLEEAPRSLLQVIRAAGTYTRLSRGSFDISIAPLLDLVRGGRPPERALERAMALVGFDDLELAGRSVRFARPGMGITLDGIAKGYIVDRASAVLARRGIQNHLVDAGGDIRVRGSRENGAPWRVAIRDPQNEDGQVEVVRLRDGAIATSGTYEICYNRERMLCHILDPATGLSPASADSVSVTAPTAMDADAISTTVFVMGPDRGVRLTDSLPRCECLVLSDGDRKRSRRQSSGWRGGVT
jgi:thiamine biosynthesis lipoprotein